MRTVQSPENLCPTIMQNAAERENDDTMTHNCDRVLQLHTHKPPFFITPLSTAAHIHTVSASASPFKVSGLKLQLSSSSQSLVSTLLLKFLYSDVSCIFVVVIYLIIYNKSRWGGCSCAKLYDSNPINFNLLGFTIFANVCGLCYFPEVDKYRSEQFSNFVQRFTLNTAHCTDHNSMLTIIIAG